MWRQENTWDKLQSSRRAIDWNDLGRQFVWIAETRMKSIQVSLLTWHWIPRNWDKISINYFRNDDTNRKSCSTASIWVAASECYSIWAVLYPFCYWTNAPTHRWCFELVGGWIAARLQPLARPTLVGYKFAGFFFPKKIRFLAWHTVSMQFQKIHGNHGPA